MTTRTPRRHPPPERAERGSATLQMVMVLPMLFGLLFTGLQAALFYQARTVAIAAAQEGARAAAGEHGTLTAGLAAASSFADQAGHGTLTQVTVTGTRTATTATVTVGGHSLSVIPGWLPTIAQTASLPVERLT